MIYVSKYFFSGVQMYVFRIKISSDFVFVLYKRLHGE